MGTWDFENTVVERGGGKYERLSNVFIVKFRIFAPKFGAVRIQCRQFYDAPNGESKVSNTGLAAHTCGIARDAIEHYSCLPSQGFALLSPGLPDYFLFTFSAFIRKYAWINSSISPSRTLPTWAVCASVRTSLTSVYGCMT